MWATFQSGAVIYVISLTDKIVRSGNVLMAVNVKIISKIVNKVV